MCYTVVMTVDRTNLEESIRASYNSLVPLLNERSLRVWGATEARRYGRGGISLVHRATGLDYKTIRRGLKEIKEKEALPYKRIRRSGGGRKKLTITQPEAVAALERMVEEHTRGDPESLLCWTSKSTYKLQKALKQEGYNLSQKSIYTILKDKGYTLQANKKVLEGSGHSDRDAQFQYINTSAQQMMDRECPVLSVDTKKKENVGLYQNKGQEYAPKGKPVKVNTHDFPDKALGKVSPYGVYDMGRNEGWVSVGISADTAAFAVNSIRTWWYAMGQNIYKQADTILITADCGGSNSVRARLWKLELQQLADELDKSIQVCHFPPGTSKWNKIEHKMFSYISMNWRARPLISYETVVNLIANTRNNKGLTIQAALDENVYPKGVEVSDEDFLAIRIERHDFHGDWNYTIRPRHLNKEIIKT